MNSKQKRSSAKGRFTRAVNGLECFLRDEEADEANAKKYFDDVEFAWKGVEEKHEEYIATLEDDTAIVAEEWIIEVQTKFHIIRKRYVKFISDYAVRIMLKTRERARIIGYETFLRLYFNLETSVKNNYPPETISRDKLILQRHFEIVKQKHSEFCVASDNSDEGLNTDWLVKLIEQFSRINNIADGYSETLNKNLSEDKRKSNIKMEQMPLPRFYGEPRFYHRFKRDFLELVLPNLEEREAAFTLRQCLGTEVETVLGSGDFDLDQMLKRLMRNLGIRAK